ncbi:hypothetical protein ECC06_06205 [Helicobacter pylori]|nr:hypothetical protein ECC06_06205 [Helicobacter pylori]
MRNVVRKFYSLKSYRFITKPFSLIVKNASSFLDFYSLFFILPLVLFFISFVFKLLVGVLWGLRLDF